jgi:hypothetical protein
MEERDPERWYADGLRFECTLCGECCRRTGGYVWLDLDEVRVLAAHLELSLDEFGLRYLRRVGQRYALLDRTGSDACVFLHEGRCRIHAVRPKQCRTFPFWPEHVRSAAAWSQTATRCEGIAPRSRLVDADEIEDMLRS